MSLANLKKKYDPYRRKEGEKSLNTWTDSAAVVRLSEYLKIHKDRGIQIISRDGRPALQFNPGLRSYQKERWQLAVNALDLLQAALPDLEYLMREGLIQLNNSGSF